MHGKILIIEDEIKIQQVVKDYFKLDGFEVESALDGFTGVQMFEDGSYDLVILDVMLPEIDGWSVLRRIRSFSEVPVIMLTARGDDADKLLGFELKADEYVTKPFSP